MKRDRKKLGLFRPCNFVFSGSENGSQMGCFHILDADFLRPLRLNAPRYCSPGAQVFRQLPIEQKYRRRNSTVVCQEQYHAIMRQKLLQIITKTNRSISWKASHSETPFSQNKKKTDKPDRHIFMHDYLNNISQNCVKNLSNRFKKFN